MAASTAARISYISPRINMNHVERMVISIKEGVKEKEREGERRRKIEDIIVLVTRR